MCINASRTTLKEHHTIGHGQGAQSQAQSFDPSALSPSLPGTPRDHVLAPAPTITGVIVIRIQSLDRVSFAIGTAVVVLQ